MMQVTTRSKDARLEVLSTYCPVFVSSRLTAGSFLNSFPLPCVIFVPDRRRCVLFLQWFLFDSQLNKHCNNFETEQ